MTDDPQSSVAQCKGPTPITRGRTNPFHQPTQGGKRMMAIVAHALALISANVAQVFELIVKAIH